MLITLVVAIAENRVIGYNNKLLWHIPEELKYFRDLTLNHTIVMGRKTYDSIGRALPNRENLILSNQANLVIPHCQIMHSINEVLSLIRTELMIIGGANIYKAFLPYAHRIFLSFIPSAYQGDVYFPELGSEWIQLWNRGYQEFSAQYWRKAI